MFLARAIRALALVGCALIVLNLYNVAHASGDGGGGGSNSSGSSGSGGGSGGGNDDGGNDDGGGDDGGGGGSTNNSGSGSQNSGSNSGQSSRSKNGTVVNQDEALLAIRAGKAVSLPMLLAFMTNKFPGEIVDVKLRNKEGQYRYEVEYLSNGAKLRKVILNAKTLGKL